MVTGSPGNFTVIACNDDAQGGSQSQVIINVSAGVTYYFMVGSKAPGGGTLEFNAQETVEPTTSVPTTTTVEPTTTTVEPTTTTVEPTTTTVEPTTTTSVANAPANDDFANATEITGLPFTDNTTTGASTESPDDPSSNCPVSYNTVWYKGTSGSDLVFEANTFGSDYDTILTVVTGSPGNFTVIACNDDAQGGSQSQVIINVSAGVTYYFMVGSKAPGGGTLEFNAQETVEPTTSVPTTTTVEPTTTTTVPADCITIEPNSVKESAETRLLM